MPGSTRDWRPQRVGREKVAERDTALRSASVEHDEPHPGNVRHLFEIGQEVLVPEFRRRHMHLG